MPEKAFHTGPPGLGEVEEVLVDADAEQDAQRCGGWERF